VEIQEQRVDENRYLEMELLREHHKRNAAPQPKSRLKAERLTATPATPG